jgi:large subunit ribosomal protein L6
MSRIGKLPIAIPDGVTVAIQGQAIAVDGPKGRLERTIHPEMAIRQEDGELVVTRPSDLPGHRALHGLTRALVANMVAGVSDGFRRVLLIEGTGYRADQDGESLVLYLGYSHPIRVAAPAGIRFTLEDRGKTLIIEGIDKERVGQVAVDIRAKRPPEPYKGKGIRYQGEHVRRKAGKGGKVKGK